MNFQYQRDTFNTLNSNPIYTTRELAAKYIELGFSITPVKFKGKNPIIPNWQNLRIGVEDIKNYFPTEPTNIGVLLGTPSGGLVDIDLDDIDAVQFASVFLPPTEMMFGRTSRPSSHRLYRVPDPCKPCKLAGSGLGSIVELRSTGQQTVFPGSIHEFAEAIAFERDGEPAKVTWEELDQGIVRVALATVLFKRWTSGNRHALALSMAGFLEKCGWSHEQAEELIEVVARTAGDEDIQDRLKAVGTTFDSVRRGKPVSGRSALIECLDGAAVRDFEKWLGVKASNTAKAAITPSDLATDAGCADAFANEHEGTLIYSDIQSQWYRRKNQIFEPVSPEIMQGVVKRFLQEQAASKPAFAQTLLKRSRINAVAELSRAQLWADAKQFDTAITIAGTRDGALLDLGGGQLVDGQASGVVTRRLGVSFNPEAKCPTWMKFLEKIFDGNDEVINFLQRSVGYSLSGSTTEQVLFILVGTGANGKSTFLRAMMHLMGDYGTTLPMQTLMEQPFGGGQTNDLAS